MNRRAASRPEPQPPSSPATPAATPARTSLRAKVLLLAVSVLVAAGLAELTLRVAARDALRIPVDERNTLHRYDENLGWFPIPSSHAQLVASRPFSVVHNSEGFRAPEPIVGNQPGIMFLGDSFVWGYDVDAAERFTDKLQARHPEWSIYNVSVSGYGTDQELMLLERTFDRYRPRVVFLVFAENDDDDNSSNIRYGGYYKPYYTLNDGGLRLEGIPVPHCERAYLAEHRTLSHFYLVRLMVRAWFRLTGPPVLKNASPTAALLREMHKFVTGKGATLMVGLTQRQPDVEKLLGQLGVPYIDLTTTLRYREYGQHWTPDGHTFVCDKVEAMLLREKWAH